MARVVEKLLLPAALFLVAAAALPPIFPQTKGAGPSPPIPRLSRSPRYRSGPAKHPVRRTGPLVRATKGPDGSIMYSMWLIPRLRSICPIRRRRTVQPLSSVRVAQCGCWASQRQNERQSGLIPKGLQLSSLSTGLCPMPHQRRPASLRSFRTGFTMGKELSFGEILGRRGNANPAINDPLQLKVISMAIADGHQAIRVLRREAAKYHIDPKRIGILGFSAGGGVAVGTAVTESSDGYPDFAATIYGPSLVDVTVPKMGAPLFIAVMDGHFNVTNGCMALFTLWKEAGRPVEIHVYDHGYGPASGMPVASWTDRFYDWLQTRKLVID